MVFDLGGGTIDTSLLSISSDGIFEVIAISGDTKLGGADFDNGLIEWCAKEFKTQSNGLDVYDNPKSLRRLRIACEKAKCELSVLHRTTIDIEALLQGEDFQIDISRKQFEEMCQPLFQKCIDLVKLTLSDGKIAPYQIHDVVLVGGSTRIPKIQEMLSNFFSDQFGQPKKLCKSINPDEAVAYGATLQAAVLNTGGDEDLDEAQTAALEKELNNLPEFVLLDVNPLSLGIETTGELMSVIIPRNTNIPIAKTKIFSTIEDNQTAVTIRIFEGERGQTKYNHLLGEFELTGIPSSLRGVPKIEVTYEIDADGIFTVCARDITDSSNPGKIETIELKEIRAKKDTVQEMIDCAKQYEEEDLKYRTLIRTRVRFEGILYSVRDLLKEEKVVKHILDDEKLVLQEIIVEEMRWLKEESHNVTEPKIFEEKMDYIQTDIVQPIVNAINLRIRDLTENID